MVPVKSCNRHRRTGRWCQSSRVTDIDGLGDGTSQDIELEETQWADDIIHNIELEERTDPVEDGTSQDFDLEEETAPL